MITIFLGGKLGILGGKLLPLKYPRQNTAYRVHVIANISSVITETMTHFSAILKVFFLITMLQINCNSDFSKPVSHHVTVIANGYKEKKTMKIERNSSYSRVKKNHSKVACLVSSITSRRSGNELALLSRKTPRTKPEREAERDVTPTSVPINF